MNDQYDDTQSGIHPESILHDAPLDDLADTLTEERRSISTVPVLRQLVVALGLLVVVFGTTYIGTIIALFEEKTSDDLVTVEAQLAQAPEVPVTETYNAFADTKLTADAAFVWDVRAQKILFNKNADEVLPLASITKLMTALVAYELLDESSDVDITVEAIREDGDSGFHEGETFSLQDLTDLTLIASSNDGAKALAAQAGAVLTSDRSASKTFIDAMNIRAEELGLANTHFKNATGLDLSPTEAGAYGTARDMALLMEYIIAHYPDVVALTKIDLTTINNEEGEYHVVKNTNEVVENIPGLIASKTGYTELAGGNLVVAFNAGLNRPIIVSVLGSTRNERFNDVLTLVEQARLQVSQE